MPTVAANGLELAYERAGEGPPLVLVHGVLCDSRAWRPQLAGLAGELTVVAWDEPGAGRSSEPEEPFGLADYADALAGLIESLGLGRAAVGGMSWGGIVVQELYRRRPELVAGLILAGTYAGWAGSLPADACAARLASCLKQSTMPAEEVVEKWMPSLLSARAPDEVINELASMLSDFRPAGFRLAVRAAAAADTRDLLGRIERPTLLLWGEHDARSPVAVGERMRDAIPGARLSVIADAGHVSNLEQPARFNDEVLEFCRGLDGS